MLAPQDNIAIWLMLMLISALSYFYGYRLGKLQGELDSYSKMLERLNIENDKTPYSDSH